LIKVTFYGIARIKFNRKDVFVEGSTVKEALTNVCATINIPFKDIKQFLIYVNEVNIQELQMLNTKLNENDTIMLLSPSSGG